MTHGFWRTVLPDRYQIGEFPGESFPMEMIRRMSWRTLPKPLLRWGWERVLLGRDGCWCFVLGVNNSGTTLLVRLLERHPGVRSLPEEGQHLTREILRPAQIGVRRLWTDRMDVFRLTGEDDGGGALRAMHDWGFRFLRQSGSVLLEKSPPNTIRSRWLQAHFPRARFISLFRHPCAVAEGIRRREGHGLREAARHWAAANRILLDDLPHLERHLELTYEDLCATPMTALGRIAEFLSLRPGFTNADLTGLSVHSLDETVERIENFNPRSFERLSDRDMEMIASEAGDVADRLGYRVPPDLGTPSSRFGRTSSS